MATFDRSGLDAPLIKPIRPTGHGYRLIGNILMGIAAVIALLGVPLFAGTNVPYAFVIINIALVVFAWGFILRVISDFLAALADIARATRERQ